ncbi:MAG: pyridoxamine 5'-phosphate oxidase family protein [Clostridia bacterium]|nr:pyridoxamine 5'-phosphate oxidase family protein [Clostridia bacterium]
MSGLRRKDKEIKEKAEIEEILRQTDVCRIALCEGNQPYIVPMNFGYKDGVVYLHSAKEGKKIDIIRENGNVCFEVEAGAELVTNDKPCSWTYRYRSVIGFGKARVLEGYEEKVNGLNIIMNHYTGKSDFEFGQEAVNAIVIIRIDIEEITGKKSGY